MRLWNLVGSFGLLLIESKDANGPEPALKRRQRVQALKKPDHLNFELGQSTVCQA